MSNHDEFRDLPELGPAGDDLDRGPLPARNGAAASAKPDQKPVKARATRHPLLILMVLLALGGVAGVGAWGFLQFEALHRQLAQQQLQLDQQRTALGLASDRVPELESLISSADESISKSGAALQSQINQLEESLAERTKQVDSELAKLASLAREQLLATVQVHEQRLADLKQQTERLVGQMGRLGGVDKALAGQSDAVKQARADLAALEGQLKPLQQSLEQAQAGLKALQATSRTQQNQWLAEQRSTAASLERLAEQERAQRTRSEVLEQQLSGLRQQVEAPAKPVTIPAELDRRIREVEQAIDAIDGSRRQTNQDLLQLKRRVNRLQLTLEQLAPGG